MKPLIQNSYVNRSTVHGWGGFAGKTFKKGDIIEECPFIESVREKKHPKRIADYLFTGNKKNTTLFILGYGAVYNHSRRSNAEYVFDDDKNVITFIAKRKINKGEEVFVDYGKEYWSSRKKKIK